MFNPDTLTLREMAGLLRRGVLTSASLVDFYLQRIAERNPQINALIQLSLPKHCVGRLARPTRWRASVIFVVRCMAFR